MVRKYMKKRILCLLLLPLACLLGAAQTDVVQDVRMALSDGNLNAANTLLTRYHDQHGADSSYLEALSWLARGALSA